MDLILVQLFFRVGGQCKEMLKLGWRVRFMCLFSDE